MSRSIKEYVLTGQSIERLPHLHPRSVRVRQQMAIFRAVIGHGQKFLAKSQGHEGTSEQANSISSRITSLDPAGKVQKFALRDALSG